MPQAAHPAPHLCRAHASRASEFAAHRASLEQKSVVLSMHAAPVLSNFTAISPACNRQQPLVPELMRDCEASLVASLALSAGEGLIDADLLSRYHAE